MYRCVAEASPATLGCLPYSCPNGSPLMIILGIILLVIGFVASIPILWTVGIILVIVGVLLEVLGATGRAVAGRRHYY